MAKHQHHHGEITELTQEMQLQRSDVSEGFAMRGGEKVKEGLSPRVIFPYGSSALQFPKHRSQASLLLPPRRQPSGVPAPRRAALPHTATGERSPSAPRLRTHAPLPALLHALATKAT